MRAVCRWFLADELQPDSIGRTRPGMFLPKALARRLRLKVLDVHSEALQSISEGGALAEGVEVRDAFWSTPAVHDTYWVLPGGPPTMTTYSDPIAAYRGWWRELHRRQGQRWEDNPSVYVTRWEIIADGLPA